MKIGHLQVVTAVSRVLGVLLQSFTKGAGGAHRRVGSGFRPFELWQ